MNTTVIYITDNLMDDKLFKLCQRNILKATNGLPLISVSQKPIDFGTNICVGILPRSSLSINQQMMKALEIVKTKYIAIAEHDCLYTAEHFSFIPPDDNVTWYNDNVWIMQVCGSGQPSWNGVFSMYPKRMANSQLICTTEMMIKTTQDRIDMMSDHAWQKKHPTGRIGEAGFMTLDHALRLSAGKSVAHIREKLKEYIVKYKGKTWSTKIPNIDIRHEKNLTRCRRGPIRKWEIHHWGSMENVLCN